MRRVGQFFGHLTARVDPGEAALARNILPAGAWALFEAMPVADRRHALDVVRRLLDAGHDDPQLLAAGLLHDAGKGRRLRLWQRVSGVLLQAVRPSLLRRLASADPRSRRYGFHLFLHHAELSAAAATAAGCGELTAAFITGRTGPSDALLARALQLADEAS